MNGNGFPPFFPHPRTEVLELDEAWGDAWRNKEVGQKQQPDKEQMNWKWEAGSTSTSRIFFFLPFYSFSVHSVPSLLSNASGKQNFEEATSSGHWINTAGRLAGWLLLIIRIPQQLRSSVWFIFWAIKYIKYTVQSYKFSFQNVNLISLIYQISYFKYTYNRKKLVETCNFDF